MPSKWLSWPENLRERPHQGPSKPTKLGFEGFDGSSPAGISNIGDPYGDRLRAALDAVCTPDYRAGMLPWLAENRPDLHRLLVVGIPDTLHHLWVNRAPMAQFDSALATWRQTHGEAAKAFRAPSAKGRSSDAQ